MENIDSNFNELPDYVKIGGSYKVIDIVRLAMSEMPENSEGSENALENEFKKREENICPRYFDNISRYFFITETGDICTLTYMPPSSANLSRKNG